MTPPGTVQPDMGTAPFWAVVNKKSFSRAFVPEHGLILADSVERLQGIASRHFNPAKLAYVEQDLDLPYDVNQGSAEIVDEIPTDVKIVATMQSPGLLVLADSWDIGWSAYVDGKKVPIVRVDHALRGVVLAIGKKTVEFRFEPLALRHGLWISESSALLLLA